MESSHMWTYSARTIWSMGLPRAAATWGVSTPPRMLPQLSFVVFVVSRVETRSGTRTRTRPMSRPAMARTAAKVRGPSVTFASGSAAAGGAGDVCTDMAVSVPLFPRSWVGNWRNSGLVVGAAVDRAVFADRAEAGFHRERLG